MSTLLDDMERAAEHAGATLSDYAIEWARGVQYELDHPPYPVAKNGRTTDWSLVVGGCPNLDDNHGAACGECEACEHIASFSWSSCDLCGSRLGGERHHAAWILPGRPDLRAAETIIHLSVCADCLFYLADGETPE